MLEQSHSPHKTSCLAEELVRYIKTPTTVVSLEQILERYPDTSVVELEFISFRFNSDSSVAFTEVLNRLAEEGISVTGLSFRVCELHQTDGELGHIFMLSEQKCAQTGPEFECMLSEIKKCTKLNKLIFQTTYIDPRYFEYLSEIMANTDLKGIRYDFSESAATNLFQSIKTTDTYFTLSHTPLSEKLVQFVKSTHKQSTGNFAPEVIYPFPLDQILERYSDTSVVELDFVRVNFTKVIATAFYKVLCELHKAGISVGLTFRNCNILRPEMLSQIKKCTKLNKLSFKDSYISGFSIKDLEEIVANTELTCADYCRDMCSGEDLAKNISKDLFEYFRPRLSSRVYLSDLSFPLPEAVPTTQTNFLVKKIKGLEVNRAVQHVLSMKYEVIEYADTEFKITEDLRTEEVDHKSKHEIANLEIKSYPISNTLDLNEVDAAKPTASTTFIPRQTALSDSSHTLFNSPQPPASAEHMPPITPSRVPKPDSSSEIESYQNVPS